MKKITALLSAFMLAFALFGCEEKNNDIETPEPEELTTETAEEPSEPVFRELKDEDFKPIDMNLNIVDDGCPVSLRSADLSGLDFGEVLTPCKSAETADKYLYRQNFDDPEQQAAYDSDRERYLQTPSGGTVDQIVCSGDILYFTVNYDDLCSRHASALFSYDLNTGESRKVNERIGLEYNGCYNGLTPVGDKLFFIERYSEENPHNYIYDGVKAVDVKVKIIRLDPATGETSDFTEISDYSIEQLQDIDGKLCVTGWDYRDEDSSRYVEMYDPETGEKTDSASETSDTPYWFWGDCGGEPVEITGGYSLPDSDEILPYVIKTKYYSIDTGMKRVSGIFAWKDRLSVIANEGTGITGEMRLYTYDLTTMERTKIKFNGFSGSAHIFEDGFIDAVQSSTIEDHNFAYKTQVYYIMPQVGMAYRVEKLDSATIFNYEDKLFLISYRHDAPNETDPGVIKNTDKFYYFNEPSKNIPEKLYWIESE